MRKRDRLVTPWLVRPTQIFEAAFNRLIAEHERDAALEVIDLFERLASIDPRMPGVQHPVEHELWLFEGPSAIKRLPAIVIVYSIDDLEGFVDMWALHRL